MKISVVTVCCNSAKTIGHTLESFFRQEHPDKELVVIDGASSDETLTIVRSFRQESVILVSEPDCGIYDAMNKGLDRYTGEAVGFLNSDDCFHDKAALSEIAAALDESDIVFGNIDFVADHISKRIVRRWRGSEYKRGSFKWGWMAPHPSIYVRRSAAAAIGKFNITYRLASDYDWMLRAFELNDFRSTFLDRPLVDMQMGGNSTSGFSAYLRGNFECLQARRNYLGAGLIDLAFLAKPLRKVTQFAVWRPLRQDLA